MAKESKLAAAPRAVSGSVAARRLRRDGLMPAVVNAENGDSRMIQLNGHDFEMLLRRHASESLVLDMAVEGEPSHKVLLKDVQHDPVTGRPVHADFMELSMTRKMHAPLFVVLVGESVGVDRGGILDHLLREIEVECLPRDLPEAIEVDVTALDIGDTFLVSQLTVNPALTILTAPDIAVACVLAPSVSEDEEAAEEEAAEGEPEVISKAAKDDEEA